MSAAMPAWRWCGFKGGGRVGPPRVVGGRPERAGAVVPSHRRLRGTGSEMREEVLLVQTARPWARRWHAWHGNVMAGS